MTTILATFTVSLLFALLLTPGVCWIARKFGIVDQPSARKVHLKPIPRMGGVAMYLAFLLSLVAGIFYRTDLSQQLAASSCLQYCIGGATLVFLMGLADDIFCLRPAVKFAVQAFAGLVAYAGGIQILQLDLPWGPNVALGWLSLPLTVFWFMLVINAINLIDGLDGLAAGVSLFASLVLLGLAVMSGKYVIALGLAALAGTCLGFLRYNFNPASIFMGDSGSYFLGYMLASLSILGSMKSQATVAMLIPVIALGVPLLDAILAPIRRFINGRALFQPDKSHIHHRLLQMGLTTRKAVLIMYGATIVLGLFALVAVNARDEKVGLAMFILAVSVILGFRKLGYLEYFAVDKMIGYFHDVTDVMGFKKDRRTFLSHQIAINDARNPDEMWLRIVDALELLRFDKAEMCFNGNCSAFHENGNYSWCGRQICHDRAKAQFRVMRLDLPLVNDRESYGTLHLYKDLMLDPISHYTIRRIEHLRRSIVRKLKVFQQEAKERGREGVRVGGSEVVIGR
ncbi:MAG: MraY family glycosyltransferase [Desulfoferrobacter sp.]